MLIYVQTFIHMHPSKYLLHIISWVVGSGQVMQARSILAKAIIALTTTTLTTSIAATTKTHIIDRRHLLQYFLLLDFKARWNICVL